jgi:hypothetical protein
LAVVIFAECALMGALTIYLVIEILTTTASSFAGALFLILLAALATVWLGFIGSNVLRGSPWVRGAILTWQVLQVAVAIGCFQGFFARPDIGWFLLAPAVAAVVLLFTRPVTAATARTLPADRA